MASSTRETIKDLGHCLPGLTEEKWHKPFLSTKSTWVQVYIRNRRCSGLGVKGDNRVLLRQFLLAER